MAIQDPDTGGRVVAMRKCSYTTRGGSPCSSAATGSNGGCFQHDPDFELARRRNARKGGQRGGRGRTAPGTLDLARLQRRFETLADKVLSGEVDKGNGAVVAQLLNGARACVIGSAKIREVEEFEERLTELERQRGMS
jgi:hypothetical protein